MKIRELREALAGVPRADDDKEVDVWLPGTYIKLGKSLFPGMDDKYLIEGDIRPGSALDA